MVRLLETCLSSIPQTETPLISRTTFGPSRWRRSSASVSEIPLLEGDLMRGGFLDTVYPRIIDLYVLQVRLKKSGNVGRVQKMGIFAWFSRSFKMQDVG